MFARLEQLGSAGIEVHGVAFCGVGFTDSHPRESSVGFSTSYDRKLRQIAERWRVKAGVDGTIKEHGTGNKASPAKELQVKNEVEQIVAGQEI
ncbi:hypothetical protein, partial [Ralstonia solanacearum]|uniref:hypothetical protein n=1 Tax=Ralstonia solanacearum TaxID=305 RepID=UPI0018AF7415